MKVAVSIPDEVFAEAEALARRLNLPRSRIYANALREFTDRHDADCVTELLNKVIAELGPQDMGFNERAAFDLMKKIDA
jgi:hypothetical protein